MCQCVGVFSLVMTRDKVVDGNGDMMIRFESRALLLVFIVSGCG